MLPPERPIRHEGLAQAPHSEDRTSFLPKLVAIQVLRGLAALAVALVHLERDWRLLGFVSQDWTSPFPFEAGVDVFFVISGFVMVYASGGLFGRRETARRFLTRRIARVVPLYWLTTAGVLLLLAVKPDLIRSAVATPVLVVTSFLFIPWPRPDGMPQPVYSLGWTLNYEMFFYALFAAVLALGWARRATVGAISALLLALVATGWLAPPLPQPLAFWTAPILIEFVLGMALGLARSEGVTLPLAARAGLLGAGMLGFWMTAQSNHIAFALPAACLVAACGLAPGRPPDRAAGSAPDKWLTHAGEALGDASYAIYLLHPFVIRGILHLVDGLGLRPGAVPFTAMALAATVAVALLSHRLVERPLLRRIRHWSGDGRGAAEARGAA